MSTVEWGPGSGRAFNALAADYDVARPEYPSSLYAMLPALAGARVLDVGAGTGIASRAMKARGAQVFSFDLAPNMLAALRAHPGSTPAVVAVGEALPVPGQIADLVTYAQAWHWVDALAGVREATRVLRPGGALACWWNNAIDDLPWLDAQQTRLEAAIPGYQRSYRDFDYIASIGETGAFASVEHHHTRWEWRLDLDLFDRWMRSKSYVALLGEHQEDFLAAERGYLREAFPAGTVVQPFDVDLVLATLPA